MGAWGLRGIFVAHGVDINSECYALESHRADQNIYCVCGKAIHLAWTSQDGVAMKLLCGFWKAVSL